ncbi:Lipase_GDSL domain-containing protein [Psidium guajava]|nr:Lipase_GDSL domain-containing protein [Psidium guajava]
MLSKNFNFLSRHGAESRKPQSPGLPTNAVGAWFSSEPICGILPMRLLCPRSELNITGVRPYDARMSLENPLFDRSRVPEKLPNSARSSGSDPLSELEDRSKWVRSRRFLIWVRIRLENEFRERSRDTREVALKRRERVALEKFLPARSSHLNESRRSSSEGI